MNIFEEVMHRLSSKTRMRSLFRDVHVEDLDRIVIRLRDVLEEKRQSAVEEKEKQQAKQSSIEAIKKMMEEKGVSVEDFGQGLSGRKKEEKYQTLPVRIPG